MRKQQLDVCPPSFRPVLLTSQTPTYKFLVPIVIPVTKIEYRIKDSFHFSEGICKQDPVLFIGILALDSFFTNLLDETIDIGVNQVFGNSDTVEGSELKVRT